MVKKVLKYLKTVYLGNGKYIRSLHDEEIKPENNVEVTPLSEAWEVSVWKEVIQKQNLTK
jgi:hypothetical protein